MSLKSNFKYSCTLRGHEADVRNLCTFSNFNQGIVSCSRDLTAKLWIPNRESFGFELATSFLGHKKFVSCVTTVDPVESIYPSGLVLTGGNDGHINVYLPDSSEPLFTLAGHDNAVSCVRSGSFGIIVSGSWDKTVRMWLLNTSKVGQAKCVMVMKEHEAAVWDVLMLPEQQGAILSASADKTVKLWRAGKCMKTFTGHNDCVRGLAALSSSQFLSCSNDASIKRWSINGECLQTYYGHKNFIYSVDISPQTSEFITSSEDRTVRVWSINSGIPVETIPTPATSAWKVVWLKNGDVAVGCSDATIRVFTRDDTRAASMDAKQAYEEELSSSTIPEAGLDVGDVNAENLPGVEALEKTGSSDGQTIMIRNNTVVEAYQWSTGESRWIKVGDVIGSNTKGKKSMYQGKEYDYVFTIDIKEGAPPLHLPYNLTEDAWFAAQKFIDDNDLSQHFLDQVANFIIDNTKGDTTPSLGTGGYTDPFTGQGRYTPGAPTNQLNSSTNDPFTGGGRYVPNGNSQSTVSTHDPMGNPSRYVPGSSVENSTISSAITKPINNDYFPKSGYIFFENRNAGTILGKIRDHSLERGYSLSEDDLKDLESLVQPVNTSFDSATALLWKLLNWEADFVFPVLDLLRLMLVSRDDVTKEICDRHDEALLELLLRHLNSEQIIVNNQLLTLRILSNLFRTEIGLPFLLAGCDRIVGALSQLTPKPGCNNSVQTAIATLFINYAVLAKDTSKFKDEIAMMLDHSRLRCLQGVAHFLTSSQQPSEALFRHLVALGTLLSDHEVALATAKSLNLKGDIQRLVSSHSGVTKIVECADLLTKLLL